MKKMYFVCFILIHISMTQYLRGNTANVGSFSYYDYSLGPIYGVSLATCSMYQNLYTAAELGIPSGSTITGIEWYNYFAKGIATSNTLKVYMENSSSTSFTSGTTTTQGAIASTGTLVYNSSTFTIPATVGFFGPTSLSPSFVYTGGSLIVSVEWNRGVAYSDTVRCIIDNPTDKGRSGAWTSGTVGSTSTLSTYAYRPYIRITYTPPPCSGTPSAGVATSSVSSACHSANFTVNATGLSNATGLTYQWQSSPAGAGTWSNLGGVLTSPALGVYQSVAMDYRVISTCTASGLSNTSSPVSVSMVASKTLPFVDGFNAIASCWIVTNVAVQTGSKIALVTTGSNPTTSPQEGTTMIRYNSNSSTNGGAGSEERLTLPSINSTGTTGIDLQFYWRHDNSAFTTGSYLNEGVQVQYSTNSATTFTNVGSFIPRVDASNTWVKKTISLPADAGNLSDLRIAFKFHSELGNNMYLDSVKVFPRVCDAASYATLASSSQSGIISQCLADASGWIYYSPSSSPNQLMFGINKGSSGMAGETVNLGVNATPYTITASSNGLNQEHQSFLMGRDWNVTATTQPSTPVQIRFFYAPADTSAVQTARDNAYSSLMGSNPSTLATKTSFEWFKSVNTPYDASWRSSIVGNKFPSSHLKLTPTYGVLNGVNYVEFTVASFSGGTGGSGFGAPAGSGSGIGLPVTWADVSVNTNEAGNYLEWKTASESNTDYFQVEYSYDGINFSEINSKIKAAGNSNAVKSYHYLHGDFSSFTYYRVKQVDLDGRFDYSSKVVAKRAAGETFKVRVTPTMIAQDGQVRVSINSVDKSEITIKIMDMAGKVMKEFTKVPANDMLDEVFDLSSLNSGIYFLEVKNGQGKQSIKLIKI